jgi:heptose-I-phosphate ethanolaminephosphotransferase
VACANAAVPEKNTRLAAVIGVVLWACSMASLGYFFIYQQEFSQSVIFIMFESNVSEAGEYMTQYFAWWMVLAFSRIPRLPISCGRACAPCTCPVARHWWPRPPFWWPWSVIRWSNRRCGQAVSRKDSTNSKVAHRAGGAVADGRGYHRYRETWPACRTCSQRQHDPAAAQPQGRMANQPATLVLVIGESTNRQRMSLYGYPRETTPELDKLKDQLAVFDNVITRAPTPSRRCNRC